MGQNGFAASSTAPIFEYTGGTALTVKGPATGREYRFPHAGARVQVEPRDLASVAQVPKLRRIL
jgi:hypothetical protein